MIRHYSISGDYMDGYIKLVDSLYADKPAAVRNIYYSLAARANSTSFLIDRELDLQKIKGDFLINNIEYSFDLWENSSHLKSVSFDDFCEYVLPYNVNHEPLREWKDSSMFKYLNMESSRIYELDLERYNDFVSALVGSYYYASLVTSPDSLIGEYSPDCIDKAFWEVMLKRSMGIPATVDYVPHFPTSENRHYWVVSIDEKYRFNKHTVYKNPYMAKVYRKTYSINPIPEDYTNYVPDILRDPYSKDVTEQYEKTSTVECELDDVPSGVKYGYLAVFNNLAWKEVAWSKLKRGRGVFEKMGREIMYMPTYYEGNVQKLGRYPLLVNTNGEVSEIIPNKDKREKLILKRKFPYVSSGESYGDSFVGSIILACNDLEKMQFDSLATITSYWNMAYDTVHIKSKNKYKHWFLKKRSDRFLTISELEFYDEKGELPKNNHYAISRTNKIDSTSRISEMIFDGNLLTSASTENMIGLSFDEPVSVSYIKYISNNDGNGVYPNDEYELLYFDNGEWVSLGKKVAIDYSIDYDEVPTNALLWLRNHTKGKEERPFMVINDKVKFW